MSKNIQLSLLLVALLSPLYAENQSTDVQLKTLSITSTAIETNELQSTDSVEVYTESDIQKAHVQNIYEFLTQQSSLTATSAYGNKFMQKIDMRGYGIGNGYQNIVINIDGRRLTNVDMVPQFLSSIAPSAIKSIEIIKSSGIVMGGDGANAGVINITSKQTNSKEISIYGGTFKLLDGSLYLGHKDSKLSLSLSAETQQSKVLRDINTNSPEDTNKLLTASLNFSYFLNDSIDLRLALSSTNTKAVYSGALTESQYQDDIYKEGTSTTIQEYNAQSINLGTSYYINNTTTLNIDAYKEKKNSINNYVTYSSISLADYDYTSAKVNIDYDVSNFKFKAGYDFYDSKRETANNTVTKASNAVYGIGEYKWNTHTFKLGARYENIDFKSLGGANQNDDLWGIELGINKVLFPNTSLYFNYSHTYQSADLDRLFGYTSGAFTGYVEPSQADNFNVGFNYLTASNKLKVAVYYINLKNEIYYYAAPLYKNTNIDASHKYGLDVYDKWILNNQFNLVVNYNYVQAIIDTEIENGNNYANKYLPGVSDHNMKFSLNYLPTSKTMLTLHQIYRSEAYAAEDFNNDFSQKQEAYASTNISASYVEKSWELFAKVNNIFNQKNGIWIKDDAIYPVNFTTTALAGFKYKY